MTWTSPAWRWLRNRRVTRRSRHRRRWLEVEPLEQRCLLTTVQFALENYATIESAISTAIVIFLIFSSVVAILWVGSHDVLVHEISPGRLGQFVLYAAFAAGALGELSQVWGEISQASGAAERLFELLRIKPEIAAPAHPRALPVPPRGDVTGECRTASFSVGRMQQEGGMALPFLALQSGEGCGIEGGAGGGGIGVHPGGQQALQSGALHVRIRNASVEFHRFPHMTGAGHGRQLPRVGAVQIQADLIKPGVARLDQAVQQGQHAMTPFLPVVPDRIRPKSGPGISTVQA